MHFVYMVRCADGTLYTGYTRDPERRAQVHNAGRGAKYTAGRRPVWLVYAEPCASRSAALKREYAVKRLTRMEKERLAKYSPGAQGSRRRPPARPGRSVSRDASRSRSEAHARDR